MEIPKIIVLILLISLFACVNKKNLPDEQIEQIELEIKQLETQESKKIYLENIFYDDQAVRDDSVINLNIGKESPEYLKYQNAQLKQDEINLIKIEKYLDAYGYPTKEMGEIATRAPWAVIHHSSDYKERERNFEIIYEAYLKGDINENAVSFYLGRMYSIKNGERLQMKSPYKQDDEINLLIKKLNLEKKKMRVIERIEKNTQDNSA